MSDDESHVTFKEDKDGVVILTDDSDFDFEFNEFAKKLAKGKGKGKKRLDQRSESTGSSKKTKY